METNDIPPTPFESMTTRAPVMVFIMVAGASGQIGAEQFQAFRAVLDDEGDHGSQMFKDSLESMKPKIKELVGEDYGTPNDVMGELAEIRTKAKELFPDQVDTYCAALHHFAKRIAESGNAGDAQDAMLRMIALTLGQEEA
jgi:dihydrodipicolinate reductase